MTTLPAACSTPLAAPEWQFTSCCIDLAQTDPGEEAWKALTRLALGLVFSMDTMMMSAFLYSDWARAALFGGSPGLPPGIVLLFKLNMLLGSTLAMLALIPPILSTSWQGLRQRRISTDALIALGSLSGYLASLYGIATGGEVYFDTATTILVFVTAGHYLELRARARGSEALQALLARTPDTAWVRRDGAEVEVPAMTVMLGEDVLVRPGGVIPVDGEVVEGVGSVNEASITGEAKPAFKEPGAKVFSGTVNLDGRLVIRAAGVGEQRVMARLVQLLHDALVRRAPIQRLADRISAVFVPLVILLSGLAFAYWGWRDGVGQGLMVALAVLLIACPCALGVATPLAIWAGMGRAAEGGVLIRSAETLEKLAGVKTIFFDKTGTLTKGTLKLAEVVGTNGTEADLREFVSRAASLEAASEHPLGKAVVVYARDRDIPVRPVRDFHAFPGLGVRGTMEGNSSLVISQRVPSAANGHYSSFFTCHFATHSQRSERASLDVAVGSPRFMERLGWPLSQDLVAAKMQLEATGRTVTCLGWDRAVRGLLGFAEEIRPEAQEAIGQLRASGLTVKALTGDDGAAGEGLSRRLGIAVHAWLLPEDKVRLLNEAQAQDGAVAMVGDGLNDAPALAHADVGIALGCGVDVTREAADVSLVGSDLRQVAWTIELAQKTYRTIRQNLWWAFVYNVFGVGLALVGVLHPIVSALAMVVSNLFVVANSLRLTHRPLPEMVTNEQTFVEEFGAVS